MIKNISAFVSKSTVRPEISGVLIAPDHIAATDSFKLIEKKCETGAKAPYIVSLPKGMKKFETVARTEAGAVIDGAHIAAVIDGDFPKYETLFPIDKPLATIKLSAKHLREVCDAFVGVDPFDAVTIEIREGMRPMVFLNEKAGMRAMLMPMTKN